MRLVAIAAVKNEGDVIEAFVRHTLGVADRLVVLDNGSTDGTLDILRALERDGPPLEIVEDPTLGKFQSRRMTRLLRDHAVGRHAADWVLPLDADEFVVVPPGGALVPPDAARERPLAVAWRTYVPGPSDDAAEPNPVVRIRHRLAEEGWGWQKVVVPGALAARPDAVLGQGSHTLTVGGQQQAPAAPANGFLAHFPVRSPGQFLAKVAVGVLQYRATPDRDPAWGWHYRGPYELLKRDPTAFAAGIAEAARRYGLPPGADVRPEVVCDPLPYRGGPLTHTPPDDGARGVRALLAYAEQLAAQYQALALGLTDEGRACLARHAAVLARREVQADGVVEAMNRAQAEAARLGQALREREAELDESRQRTHDLAEQLRRAEVHRREAEARLAAEVGRVEDALRRSWTWKAGRLLVGPLSRLRSARRAA